jgi:hypothetical protein
MRVPTIAEATLTVRDDRDQLIQNAAKDVSPDVIGDAKPYQPFGGTSDSDTIPEAIGHRPNQLM